MTHETLRRPTLALAILLGLSAACAADEVTDQIEAGRRAYTANELRTSIQALNFAVAKIQERITANLLTLLPPPRDGWAADAGESQSGGVAAMLTGTTLSRRYHGPDGAEVELNLMADSPLMPMLTMALSMPFMAQANQNLATYSFKGNRGTIEHAPETRDYEITLLVGNRLVIRGKGTNLATPEAIELYLGALDLDAIQKALTN